MNKHHFVRKHYFIAALFFLAGFFFVEAQQYTLRGTVVDKKTGDPLPSVNVVIKGTDKGGITNFEGKFEVSVDSLPVTLQFKFLGYKPLSRQFYIPNNYIRIELEPESETLNSLVITASKTMETVLESPVTVEQFRSESAELSALPDYYNSLGNVRGVQVISNSITMNTINTRGFSSFANIHMLQLVDGVDDSSPALNFPLGNLVGSGDLDLQKVEILAGPSSALYGANAFNGLINIITKNPFEFPGFSSLVQYGYTNQSAAGLNPYKKAEIRFAHAWDKFAFKMDISYMNATDWYAVDTTDIDMNPRNHSIKGDRQSNPSYDGMNIYGDEIATDINLSSYGLGTIRVSRTGYAEKDLTDYKADNLKGNIGFYYRPKGKETGFEISWISKFGMGKTIYQEANRFNLRDIFIHQHKLELKNNHYFLRAYYVQEDAGKSYDTRFAAWNINRAWKSDQQWFSDYVMAFVFGKLNQGWSDEQAHAAARKYADNGRLEPGTSAFEQAFEKVIADPDAKTGAKFHDKSGFFHTEFNYVFSNLIKRGNIQLGSSFRRYSLRSNGTIFTDYGQPIFISQYSVFSQFNKKLLNNHLKLSFSVRYDQQPPFKASISPRGSMIFLLGKNRNHSLRVTYLTGYRNPTTRELYIGMDLGYASLVGGAPDNYDRYSETHRDLSNNPYTITGNDVYKNAYTLSSFNAYLQSGDPSHLKAATIRQLTPEKIQTFEFGYRGQWEKGWFIDLVAYKNTYSHFLITKSVVAIPENYGSVNDATGLNALLAGAYKTAIVFTNSDRILSSYGVDIAITRYWKKGLRASLIYDYSKPDFSPGHIKEFKTYYNLPRHIIKFNLSDETLIGNLGFNMGYQYIDKYFVESSFADAWVPQHHTFDAMVSYRIPKYNLMAKAGGSNIFGPDYMVAPGTGKVGQIFYFSLLFKK